MNVNSLYPIIVTDDLEASISFYCDRLGFHQKHDLTRIDQGHIIILNNDKGFEIELMQKPEKGPVKVEPGIIGLRMNVDSVEEAYAELKTQGCTIVSGIVDIPVGKILVVKDNTGTTITLMEHKKK